MEFLRGSVREYSWGSPGAIPRYFGGPAARCNVAEVWLGAHVDGPAAVVPQGDILDREALYGTPNAEAGIPLDSWIANDPQAALGHEVVEEHGPHLPYLLKVIAPNEPLSLQVHPSRAQAAEGFRREDAQGVARSSAERNYKDTNHKPEMVYALTDFTALAGFRTSRRVRDVLRGLDVPFAQRMRALVHDVGVRGTFASLVSGDESPSQAEIHDVARACSARLAEGSPSPRVDAIVGQLAEKYPGDPGVVASLLMNPVSLAPGEALFIDEGTLHAYLSGVAVEIMATSDNVLRAGLTPKHVDVEELLAVLTPVASPPTRIAAERVSPSMSTFYSPVDDFELSVIRLRDANKTVRVKGEGPRTVLCLRGAATLETATGSRMLRQGQAVFVPADDGKLTMRGVGHLVQASVP